MRLPLSSLSASPLSLFLCFSYISYGVSDYALVASGAVTDFSKSSKVGSVRAPRFQFTRARIFHPGAANRDSPRPFPSRPRAKKRNEKERRASADGNHFLVGARVRARSAAVRIQPDSRFDYVVRVSITISKQRAAVHRNGKQRAVPRRDTRLVFPSINAVSSVRPACIPMNVARGKCAYYKFLHFALPYAACNYVYEKLHTHLSICLSTMYLFTLIRMTRMKKSPAFIDCEY